MESYAPVPPVLIVFICSADVYAKRLRAIVHITRCTEDTGIRYLYVVHSPFLNRTVISGIDVWWLNAGRSPYLLLSSASGWHKSHFTHALIIFHQSQICIPSDFKSPMSMRVQQTSQKKSFTPGALCKRFSIVSVPIV